MDWFAFQHLHRGMGGHGKPLGSFDRIIKPVYMDTINTATVDTFKAKRSRETCRRRIPKAQPANGDGVSGSEGAEQPRAPVFPATVNKELRRLRAAFRKARQWGMLDEVLHGADRPGDGCRAMGRFRYQSRRQGSKKKVHPTGVEPVTFGFVVRCSIQLS
jgi:hypothetical protein